MQIFWFIWQIFKHQRITFIIPYSFFFGFQKNGVSLFLSSCWNVCTHRFKKNLLQTSEFKILKNGKVKKYFFPVLLPVFLKSTLELETFSKKEGTCFRDKRDPIFEKESVLHHQKFLSFPKSASKWGKMWQKKF